ncbi:MAG TPA: beta-propeller domain-containing protein, partial [Candidatus Saccharimonadales bacterium]|nr:beta-propeller domain-containing protein [Candidatus Saccharimonadales bacterium]
MRAVEKAKAPPPPLLSTNNIHSIATSGNTVVIGVLVPAGTNQVVLQSQPTGKGGAWKPVAVQRVTGAARELVFKVAKSKTKTSYRAMIQPLPLPAKFYKGRSSFPGAKGSAGSVTPRGGTLAAPVTTGSSLDPTTPATASGAVAESDIWNIDNDRLYFFNQYRGLQVFDVSNPDSPTQLGALTLAASGEQMYVLDSSHVLLLTQDCSGSGQSQLTLVDVSGGVPILMTNLPLAGYVSDSRHVGTSVYLAYTVFNYTNGDYEYGTQISAYDFSNPGAPRAGATLDLPGWNNILTASGDFLLAVSSDPTNYWQSDVACIDISAGNGAMTLLSTIQTAGQVQDQFSLNLSNNVLTTVSEAWNFDPVAYYYGEEIWLENFSLANPAAATRLAALDVGSGYLGAARFDANRAYIASEYGSAPLTIVDLSQPANPIVAGQVNDPSAGQSLIFPLGHQLVTIGPDTNDQTSLSLFDVTDAANASLLSQVDLGTNYSWSEAEYDVQAFTLLPSAGLIMVPYQSYDPAGASSSGIQLIDLTGNSLALRGVIAQAQARRAALLHNRVLSISGTDLVTADISDQDHPVTTDDLVLSWPVDQVFLSGGYVLELSTGVFEQGPPILTVAAAATPNGALSQWTLTNSSVLGATLQNGRLYLLQGPVSPGIAIDPPVFGLDDGTSETNGTTLTLSIVDLSSLPALTIVGETNIAVAQPPGAGVQAVWPQPETLVWVATARQEWFWPFAEGIARPLTPATP